MRCNRTRSSRAAHTDTQTETDRDRQRQTETDTGRHTDTLKHNSYHNNALHWRRASFNQVRIKHVVADFDEQLVLPALFGDNGPVHQIVGRRNPVCSHMSQCERPSTAGHPNKAQRTAGRG